MNVASRATSLRHEKATGAILCAMINEHDCVVLTQDLPNEKLKAGDIGTVVHAHPGGAAYEVEFMTLAGETVAVATLLPSQVRSIARRDIAHARELAAG